MSDLISKSELKREVKHRCVLSPLDAPYPLTYGNTDLFELLDQMPTIEAEPIKHGRWIYIRDEENNGLYECSECHKGDIHAKECKVSYCWNCGAQMMDEVTE